MAQVETKVTVEGGKSSPKTIAVRLVGPKKGAIMGFMGVDNESHTLVKAGQVVHIPAIPTDEDEKKDRKAILDSKKFKNKAKTLPKETLEAYLNIQHFNFMSMTLVNPKDAPEEEETTEDSLEPLSKKVNAALDQIADETSRANLEAYLKQETADANRTKVVDAINAKLADETIK